MPVEIGARTTPIPASLIEATGQLRWAVPHATWFTLMGVGGGIFLLARIPRLPAHLGVWLGLPIVDLISFIAIAVGGLVLIADLGRPLRFLRAALRPQTSWISRGALADFVFLVAGSILVLPGLAVGDVRPFAWLPWDPLARDALGQAIEVLAVLSAAVVVFYAGQVLADSTAIPYWRSPAIPVQFVLSSLAISMAVLMLLETLNGVAIGAGELWLLLSFLVLLLATIGWHLGTDTKAPGKAESLEDLLRGRFRLWFLAGVVGAGTILPALLAGGGLLWAPARDAVGLLCLLLTLPAGFALRLITLRVGRFPPVRAPLRMPDRRSSRHA